MHNSLEEKKRRHFMQEIKRKQLLKRSLLIIERLNQYLIPCISLLLFVIDELSSSLIWERYDEDGFSNLNKNNS